MKATLKHITEIQPENCPVGQWILLEKEDYLWFILINGIVQYRFKTRKAAELAMKVHHFN